MPPDATGQTNEPTTMHALVEGRVQGVGYRMFVHREARKRALGGGVRNRNDGRVEVFARGARKDLEGLLEALRRGPFLSHVDRIETDWDVAAPAEMGLPSEPTDFTIVH